MVMGSGAHVGCARESIVLAGAGGERDEREESRAVQGSGRQWLI